MKRKILVTVVIVSLLVAGGLALTMGDNLVQAASGSNAMTNIALGYHRGHVDPEALAQALGISIDELEEAKATAVANAIDQALELGLITQEQADELISAEISSLRGLYKLLSSDERDQLDDYTFLIDALGITKEAYQAALEVVEQAQLDQAIAEGRITQEDADAIAGQRALMISSKFTERIKTAYQTAITEALEDGTITQEQADALLAKLENANFSFFHERMRHDGGHGHGEGPSKSREDFTPEGSDVLDDLDE